MRWPLMQNNVRWDDCVAIVGFLDGGPPRLTQGDQVAAFEREFAEWLGVKYAVMVNSGASANLVTMHALKELHRIQRVLVPVITWSSDIMSVIHAGLTPVFADVDPRTLGMDWRLAHGMARGVDAIFPTHCLGFNAMPGPLPTYRSDDQYVQSWIIEDSCEALGATDEHGRKLGIRGLASNFSFYYAHHMSTIEGGMICTDDEAMYETCRVLRGHGLTREIASDETRKSYERKSMLTYPDFTFEHCGFNVRSTEINAVIGRSQLKRLHQNIEKRTYNLLTFLSCLDGQNYRIDYPTEGSSNYALPLVLVEPDPYFMGRVLGTLQNFGVEYRRGTAGGGNQLRQPYLRRIYGDHYENFPQAEHIHKFGLYIGNYPGLEAGMIEELCEKLNAL